MELPSVESIIGLELPILIGVPEVTSKFGFNLSSFPNISKLHLRLKYSPTDILLPAQDLHAFR